jgi:biopolymer transport protein ExbB
LAGFAFPLAGYRLWVLRRVENSIRGQMGNPEIRADNPLGRVLTSLAQVQGADVEVLNLTLDQSLLTEQVTLDRSLPLLRLLAAIAPMLGLLGTVTGMIATFQAIALHGSGDPKLMSGGISEALVTTVEGLVVAIPILLLHSVLVTKGARINTLLAAHGAAAVARRLIGES